MKMLKSKYYTLFFFLTLVCWCKNTHGQSRISVNEAKQLVEKTVLVTDRETYAVNEDILFSAFNLCLPELRNND